MNVYMIRNRLNGKIYVGATTQSLKRRIQAHIDNKSPVGVDVERLGRESFDIAVLESCATKDHLFRAELEWQDRLDSFVPNGYNIRRGNEFPESAKDKIRGRIVSTETRLRISRSRKGKKATANQLKGLMVGWNTPQDKKRYQGERNPNAALTEQQVREIRKTYESQTLSQEAIAKMYGIKQVTVSAIVRRRIWKLPEEY